MKISILVYIYNFIMNIREEEKVDQLLMNYYKELCNQYLCEIRNTKYLDPEMIKNIRYMTDEDKLKIIVTYNEVLGRLNILFK